MPRLIAHRPARRHRITGWIGRNIARLHYAFHIEPTWLEVNRLDLPVNGLAAGFDGYRVAQLSDLHCGKGCPPGYLDRAVDLTLAERPDLVVLTGDFIHHGYDHVAEVGAVVARLRAPDGTFAVLGNHDFSVRNSLGLRRHRDLHLAVADALVTNGVRLLRNENVRLRRAGSELGLSGVDDLWSRECDLDAALAGLPTELPRLVLAHNPQTVHRLGDRRCDVMLSGHTHGGQINMPGLGRVVLGRKARRLAAGLYEHHHTQLYVNKGVGFGWKVRYRVRPEVAVFTLRPV